MLGVEEEGTQAKEKKKNKSNQEFDANPSLEK